MDWPDAFGTIKRNPDHAEAFGWLKAQILRWSRRDLWNRYPAAVDDVVAVTCERVVLNIHKARAPETFAGFVIGHYKNVLRIYLREMKQDSDKKPIDDDVPDRRFEVGPVLEELLDCLRRLEGREKEAIEGRFLDGMTYPYLSKVLKVRPGNCRRIVFNAMEKLRACMQAENVRDCNSC